MFKNEKTQNRLRLAGLAVALLLAAGVFLGRSNLAHTPFTQTIPLDGPSGVFSGASGRVYIIDNGLKSVLILNPDGELETEIKSSNRGFYYASLVAEDEAGNIYVADTLYAGTGTLLRAERVFCYDKNGRKPQKIYEITYDDPAEAPMQYGRITSLRLVNGNLLLTLKTKDGAGVATVSLFEGMSNVVISDYPLPGLYVSDLNLDPKTNLPVFTTRLGQIGAVGVRQCVQLLGVRRRHRP